MLIACKCFNLTASSSKQAEKIEKNLTKSDNNGSNSGRFFMHGVDLDELQKRQKTNRIYAECLEFLRQAIGPLNDLAVTINQADLIYKVPIESWSLHYCINCNTITHADHTSDSSYLINSTLLTNNEEINSLKLSKSFSNTFGILMIDHQKQLLFNSEASTIKRNSNNSSNYPSNVNYSNNKIKQNRIKNLTHHLNSRLQKEIFETDERIRRYTEQQFALLKSFREKAEQEYQILVSLVNHVPEPLNVIDAIDNNLTTNSAVAADGGAIDNTQNLFMFKQQDHQQQQQQVSSLDTPPATPDSTPMSVGNSPTFRQQTSVFGGVMTGRSSISTNIVGGSLDSDCLFELEGMESYPVSVSNAMSDVEETEDAEDALGELDSGMQIPRSNTRKPSFDIAKSLPISIAAATQGRYNMENLDDEIAEDSNIDIAASIKALAKSVHGDTIFGDLPRPRFSTQI